MSYFIRCQTYFDYIYDISYQSLTTYFKITIEQHLKDVEYTGSSNMMVKLLYIETCITLCSGECAVPSQNAKIVKEIVTNASK